MAHLGSVLAFLQGIEAYRRRAQSRLYGSPFIVRLSYLGGHPGIFRQQAFLAGMVSDKLRLVDEKGDRCFDLPVERICGLAADETGQLRLDYEPTAGLVTTVAFQAVEGPEGCRKLVHMLMHTA
jgi:hypothetical protein